MKRFLTILLAALLFLNLSTTSYAAVGKDFDANYYAEKYPDVKSALGTDPNVLYKHYITYGIYEGRFQNATEEATGIRNTDPTVYITPIYDTYVDIDLTFQLVTYFKDGVQVFQSPCVTGNVKAKRNTPTGEFKIYNKIPGKILKGPTWRCWVDRWMPFNKSIGLHDAKWRKSFGGDIYQNNGSHGCVNLPHDKAVELYDLISVGTTVVVHE